jgi:hypothetical protein
LNHKVSVKGKQQLRNSLKVEIAAPRRTQVKARKG